MTEDFSANWQSHRVRCLELAAKFGATVDNYIEVADKIGLYILTKSDLEVRQTPAKEPQPC